MEDTAVGYDLINDSLSDAENLVTAARSLGCSGVTIILYPWGYNDPVCSGRCAATRC